MRSPQWHPETLAAHCGVGQDLAYGSVSTPIYQTVTYQHPGENLGQYDYSRTENPTRHSAQEAINRLDGGAGALLYGSGMAALTALVHMLHQGDHVIVTDDAYGGTYRLLVDVFAKFGIRSSMVNTRQLDAVERAFTDTTRLVIAESPSNPLLQVSPLRALAEMAHAHGAKLAIDNTFMTAVRQRPLDLGADFAVYSATKYMAGHNDVLAGATVCRYAEDYAQLNELTNATGSILGPWDAWLLLRGLKTLAIRMDRQEANAAAIAAFLARHPRVQRVFYPGLNSPEQDALQKSQASGTGAMLSFVLDDPNRYIDFMNALQLILPAVSLGGVESLITHPFNETHRELPEEVRWQLGIIPGLMRLSVGIEHVDDLMADLDQALNSLS
ncbi:MAG: PLP-dependent transferase [Sulfobacillus thermosulfidooxidans]|uniref:cysteine-S-conjugate beta-lyase n=1 Tax=Sulfobacillus thermotolerans TaxID=338644 RepID=A0ABN5H4P8_9FIRM|nr:PLP-dependent aspartate aminotransferase family protein [Sulfobacillus sp. hq2]AUW95566.1 cystathionine gamma-synthase [Sulfobacillus thermotolerans]MCY0908090.1 PLP-dependent aspartate aminotransferase family protein [Sulfobacillus thermotolerans]POB09265.1 cystathionine gamma-synthase [Sulfobacillus sp. hq2]PSR37002.1 MAG: PLP-dependent transferase [Sulfobacillus thermosulfidooxidans]